MNQEFSRVDRVSAEIMRTLSEILHRDTKDPRLQAVNITECKISKDLGIAKIYFTVIGCNENDQAAQDAIKALEKANRFFRSEIGKAIKLRITPELRFYYDTVAENASHIESLIFKALHKKD